MMTNNVKAANRPKTNKKKITQLRTFQNDKANRGKGSYKKSSKEEVTRVKVVLTNTNRPRVRFLCNRRDRRGHYFGAAGQVRITILAVA